MQTTQTAKPQYVPEFSDNFLALFPHRHDYIYATHPRPGDTPEWRTESRHPLSDRLINQNAYLYGVRFGATTQYCVLDIDRRSPYHPLRDKQAIANMAQALEAIGLCAFIAVTSSRSGGIHLYFPFEQSIASWQIGASVTHLLQQAGFTIERGLLEVFPNPRNYDPDTTTLYNAHRLPLQDGSLLLDDTCRNFTFTTPEHFVHQWQWCMSKNDVQREAIAKVASQARRKYNRLTHRGSKFLNDLNACIDPGWSDHGQTNYILGRIALREYVFGHLLRGTEEPLEGDRLTAAIVETATQLPGYRDWCRHQHEIWTRAEQWTRCVENSKYFHWATPKPQPIDEPSSELAELSKVTWNSWQSQQARDRLRWAIANLLEQGTLPAGARDRFQILTRDYRFSGQTLYHHRDLWHPDHLWNSPPIPPYSLESVDRCQPDGATPTQTAQSLFSTSDRNTNRSEGYRQFLASLSQGTGCNTPLGKAFSHLANPDEGETTHETMEQTEEATDTT